MNTHEARMARFAECALYVVITEAFCAGRAADDVLRACLEAGVRLVQFREKDFDTLTLCRRAESFRRLTADVAALLIIDDRVDIALAVDADGVHLGQTDLSVNLARRVAPELILGASTRSIEQAIAAQAACASYVNIGPIYETQTKSNHGGAIGPEAISEIAPHLQIPFTCMGGIKAHNLAPLVARGARHLAVVTAVSAAPDPAAAARELQMRISDCTLLA